MKKLLAVLTTALLAVGLAGVGSTTASATEECVAQDAWTETITEAVPGTPAVAEVSHLEYEFEHAPNGKYKTRWESDSNWNANSNPNSTGWRSTGETQTVVTVPGVDAIETVPAVVIEHAAVVCDTDEPPVVVVPETIKVYWQLPEGTNGSSPFDSLWPQKYLGNSADNLQCGYTAQWDIYRYTTDADIAAVDALWADGILSAGPEDQGLHPTTDGSSWGFVYGGDCPPPVVDACPSDFKDSAMWEVTWGHGFADRNGGNPVFTMASNGGLTGINGAGIPSYMDSTWQWLYINKPASDRVVTYQFADGTERSATITADEFGCPEIVWAETPPVVVPEEPDTMVTHTEWVEGLPDCELETVTSIRTTTTTTYALVDNVWVPTATDTVESTERATTEAECPTVVIPPVEPPVVTPPTVNPPVSVTPTDSLAYTGVNVDGYLIGGGILFGMGVLALIGAAYRRAHTE